MTTAAAESGSIAVLLDWLASQPTGGTSDEIAQLRQHIDHLNGPAIGPVQHHRCIELFYGRALRVASDFKPRLIEAGLPLDRSLHASTKQLAEALEAISEGFLRVTRDIREGAIRPQRRLVETVAARGLRMLSETLELAALAGGLQTPALWPTASALIEACGQDSSPADPDSGESAQFAFKRLIALGCLQLERLSQAEIAWLGDYLNRIAALLQIESSAPSVPDVSWFWLAISGPDSGPQSLLRRPPASSVAAFYISTAALAKRISEHLARLEAGQQPFELNLPKVAMGVQPMSLLQRLRFEWAVAAKREQPRRVAQYQVQACTGIEHIWRVLRDESAEGVIQEWQALNESPGGFSIMHVAGIADGLGAGTAVALRNDPSAAWTICVVRWIRSDNPAQVELGLQVVSTGATPVMVGFRGSRERPNKMVRALVLPALPALRHHPAVLAPTGTYTSRRFALVSDLDRVYVAQGRLLSLDMQTANVELFQFEIDPYPI